MVLGKLPVPGRPTISITVGQGPIALAEGAGEGGLDIFTLIYPFSSSSRGGASTSLRSTHRNSNTEIPGQKKRTSAIPDGVNERLYDVATRTVQINKGMGQNNCLTKVVVLSVTNFLLPFP